MGECIDNFEAKTKEVEVRVAQPETSEQAAKEEVVAVPSEAVAAASEPAKEEVVALTHDSVKPRLRSIVEDMLALDSPDDLHEDTPLMAVGMDSLASLAFANS